MIYPKFGCINYRKWQRIRYIRKIIKISFVLRNHRSCQQLIPSRSDKMTFLMLKKTSELSNSISLKVQHTCELTFTAFDLMRNDIKHQKKNIFKKITLKTKNSKNSRDAKYYYLSVIITHTRQVLRCYGQLLKITDF